MDTHRNGVYAAELVSQARVCFIYRQAVHSPGVYFLQLHQVLHCSFNHIHPRQKDRIHLGSTRARVLWHCHLLRLL